ncbi:class I lanthipeptide [uncultured Aquimarina sp.]|uniref:class I lanthipeptide n=1 Tax=uncultured Aquimarina sp. TaxID=575652 RepID=UPI00262F8B6E|nr:class I lanthipeptide [uncultured Aquimarina sp.]
MKNKKGKKLSLQKIKVAKLEKRSFYDVKGGNTLTLHNDATLLPDGCNSQENCPTDWTYDCSGSNGCKSRIRICGVWD